MFVMENLEVSSSTFQPYLDSIRKELQAQDPTLLSIIVAVLVVVLSIVVWKLLQGRTTSRRAVLLVGICDAGKTLLFIRLLSGKFKKTQTSITDSSAVYRVKNDKVTTLTVIDLPGYDSLRYQFLERFKAAARAVIFVVDSAAFQKEVREVAEFLYSILTDSVILRNAPPLLIACNKQDITMSKSAKLIQQQLEKELNTLRVTRAAAPSSLDSSGSGGAVHLGRKGKDFEFSHLSMKVEFVECSARGSKGEDNKADLERLEMWLNKIA